jgi:hypothetical protein
MSVRTGGDDYCAKRSYSGEVPSPEKPSTARTRSLQKDLLSPASSLILLISWRPSVDRNQLP